MQTNQLNSDKASIASNGSKISRKGFLRWTGLAAAGALVLTLALACTTPTSEKTAVAPTERAEEMPTSTTTTAPAEATRESEAEITPEVETFEGTLRFIVVNGDNDSSARLAALNDQHRFESLFKARVGIESGVSAIAEIDMRDPAGRVMVRLKKDMPEGQNQPSEMAVKDLALSTETEAVIYQNEAEGLVFFWTESLETAQFAPAKQEMVGEAVAAPMFDVRRDKTGDANWIKAVVSTDAQGKKIYKITHESDANGSWVPLTIPVEVPESETIFAVEMKAEQKAMAELWEKTVQVQALRIIGADTSSLVTGRTTVDELYAQLSPADLGVVEGFLNDPRLTDAMGVIEQEIKTAIDSGVNVIGAGGQVELPVEWQNRAAEALLTTVQGQVRESITQLAVLPADQEEMPVVTTLNLGGKAIEVLFSWNKPLDTEPQYRPIMIETTKEVMADPVVQAEIARRFVEFLKLGQDGQVMVGRENMTAEDFAVYESSTAIADGQLHPVEDGKDSVARVVPDKIEFYFIHEDEDPTRLLKMVQKPESPLNIGMFSYDEHLDLKSNGYGYPNMIWFMQEIEGKQVMTLIRVQPGDNTGWEKMNPKHMLTASSMVLEHLAMAERGEPLKQEVSDSSNILRDMYKEMVYNYFDATTYDRYQKKFNN